SIFFMNSFNHKGTKYTNVHKERLLAANKRQFGRRISPGFLKPYRLDITRSPISFVPIVDSPGAAMSAVRWPWAKVFSTAASIAQAASSLPNEYRSIMAAERMVARGFAMFLPAISGAEPWMGS